MTQPEPTKIAVQVGTSIQPGPDGKPWVQLQLGIGLTTAAMLLPADTADELATILAKALPDAARQARLAAGGIIVPGPGQGAAQAAQSVLGNGHRP